VKTGNRRKRILKPDEIKRVWAAAETQGYPYGTIVQLLAITGQRGANANPLAKAATDNIPNAILIVLSMLRIPSRSPYYLKE
jgi:integrase